MGPLARVADRRLLRGHGLLRRGQRELHHSSIPAAVRGGLLVHRIDVAAPGPLRRRLAQNDHAYQAVSGWSLDSCLKIVITVSGIVIELAEPITVVDRDRALTQDRAAQKA